MQPCVTKGLHMVQGLYLKCLRETLFKYYY